MSCFWYALMVCLLLGCGTGRDGEWTEVDEKPTMFNVGEGGVEYVGGDSSGGGCGSAVREDGEVGSGGR